MKLSDGEKIIIAMLADIHKALKIEGETDVEHLMASISGGHLWSIKQEWVGLLPDREDDPAAVKETADILDMWYFIETGYDQLSPVDKLKVDAENYGRAPRFSGFDGNNDEHYGIGKHWIEVVGGFAHFKGRDLNSHTQTSLPRYRKMYPVFEKLRPEFGTRDVSADDLIEILKAP